MPLIFKSTISGSLRKGPLGTKPNMAVYAFMYDHHLSLYASWGNRLRRHETRRMRIAKARIHRPGAYLHKLDAYKSKRAQTL